ncbi:MAG: efflux RND transporter periplasmic adaptor subunit, partial [Coleofasciculus sp. S288]|nr:efflux RND transporter periplasmic adaptor subunit [Coleofasciculus sp. S288]
MNAPESPKYLASSETEQTAVADDNQGYEDKSLSKEKFPRQRTRWPFVLGAIILIALGGGFGWRWWQASRAGNAQQGPAAGVGQPQGIP